ncbi:MAG: hypothetical protein ACI8PQ_002432 [Planctomycetota bacterium]|jgi:hypothetical protein
MMIVSGLAVLVTALVTSALSGARTTTAQDADFRLSSSVESLGGLAVEDLWSDYINNSGGVPGTLVSFKAFLSSKGIDNLEGDSAPLPGDGFDLMPGLDLPLNSDGLVAFNGALVDSIRLVRQDDTNLTRLWVTVQTTSAQGGPLARTAPQRAAQQAWTIQPSDFAGFEFALLANNVNCIFCHTNVGTVERWFGEESDGANARVRVGTLESLHIRNRVGNLSLGDGDADSIIAGTLYTRGSANIQDGTAITDWADQSLKSRLFDGNGELIEDAWGDLTTSDLSPAGDPPGAGENLYLDYSDDYADMVDGSLPTSFPPPFSDDGGIDPDTGEPDPDGIGNRIVDDAEFDALASIATGTISGGTITVVAAGESIEDTEGLEDAFTTGNRPGGLSGSESGSVVMIGTAANPLVINEDIVIDGDVIITGVVKGEGSIIARGNVYMPSDLEYLDGTDSSGNRTFGYAADGQRNAIGFASGGNIMIGDFQAPATIRPNGQYIPPGPGEIISGNPDTGDPLQDEWSFALSEMSLFNRGEWSRTQEFLPGSSSEANGNPSDWSVPNPDYAADYTPRYYGYAEGTIIPLMTNGGQYFDSAGGAWTGGPETTISWDPRWLTYADPGDPNDPILFNSDGSSKAVTATLSPTGSWIQDDMYKAMVEYLESTRPFAKPLSIDGLVYTNNSIFSIVNRSSSMFGRTVVNGALVAADIGLLAPGFRDPNNYGGNQSPQSSFAVGLQLNYDKRVKNLLNVVNDSQVSISRTLWDPAIGVQ